MISKTYWSILKKSTSSTKYYLELLKTPLFFSLKFFFISIFLLGLFSAFRLNRTYLTLFSQITNQSFDQLQREFPSDLKFFWDGKSISSTTNVPLEIPYPEALSESEIFIKDSYPATFGYFIPEEITQDKISSKITKNSFFVISKDTLFINDTQNNWVNFVLNMFLSTSPFEVNSQNLSDHIGTLKSSSFSIFEAMKIASFFIIPLTMAISLILKIVLETFFVYLIAKINHFKLNYQQIFKISLHVIVIAEAINQASKWFYPYSHYPMLSLSYWLIMIYIFFSNRKKIT